jgi:hypothetical protein
MHIAARLLEDQDYVDTLLAKSSALLSKHRLIAESLLSQAGITFHDKGYVKDPLALRCAVAWKQNSLLINALHDMRIVSPDLNSSAHLFDTDLLSSLSSLGTRASSYGWT